MSKECCGKDLQEYRGRKFPCASCGNDEHLSKKDKFLAKVDLAGNLASGSIEVLEAKFDVLLEAVCEMMEKNEDAE